MDCPNCGNLHGAKHLLEAMNRWGGWEIGEDLQGQIVIYTGIKATEEGKYVPFEACPECGRRCRATSTARPTTDNRKWARDDTLAPTLGAQGGVSSAASGH